MLTVIDGIEAEHFSRQVKPDDLLFSGCPHAVNLQRTGPDRIDRGEFLPLFEHHVITMQGPPALDQPVDLVDLRDSEPMGYAQGIETAFPAVHYMPNCSFGHSGSSIHEDVSLCT